MFSRAAFDALAADGITRAWDGLGGSHTFVTYPPLDSLCPLSPESILPGLDTVTEFNLYVHLPFCEMTCPFCPYETHVIAGSTSMVETYLGALAKEMDLLAPHLRQAAVQSLYIGGGTATVLSEVQLRTLFAELRRHFSITPECLVCVETSPNALIDNPGKSGLLKELGVKRISVGVQTFTETALRSEGRTHRPDETVRLLQTIINERDVVNVDLMQDMPGQTDADLEKDIEQIARLRPGQVTWYVERLRKYQGAFPDPYHSVSRRLWIRDRMKEISYHARPGGRFVRDGCSDDAFKKIRCGLDSHLIGLGASAYSHVPGYFYRNAVDTAAYIDGALAGRLPVATGFQLRKVDLAAAALASGLRWGVSPPSPDQDVDVDAYLSDATHKLETLRRHRLVDFDPASGQYRITLDGPGWAYEEEICSLFAPQDVVDRIRGRNLPWWHDPKAARPVINSASGDSQ
jgi:oxygen-independent coproporphyrinogen-3 oxidase